MRSLEAIHDTPYVALEGPILGGLADEQDSVQSGLFLIVKIADGLPDEVRNTIPVAWRACCIVSQIEAGLDAFWPVEALLQRKGALARFDG